MTLIKETARHDWVNSGTVLTKADVQVDKSNCGSEIIASIGID